MTRHGSAPHDRIGRHTADPNATFPRRGPRTLHHIKNPAASLSEEPSMKLIPTIAACGATLALSGPAFAGAGRGHHRQREVRQLPHGVDDQEGAVLGLGRAEVQGRRGCGGQDRQLAQDRRCGRPQEGRRERRRPEGGRRHRSLVQVAEESPHGGREAPRGDPQGDPLALLAIGAVVGVRAAGGRARWSAPCWSSARRSPWP